MKFLRMNQSDILKYLEYFFIFYLLVLMAYLLISFNFLQTVSQHYIFLADAFLHGRPYFNGTEPIFSVDGTTDISFFGGRGYWPLGPFPAILLMPFVAVWNGMRQGYLSVVLIAFSFYLLYNLAKKFKFKTSDALWLAVSFVFGSAYLGVAFNPVSWFFAHIIGVCLLLLALYEFFNKKRFWLVGLLLGLAIATRGSYILAPLFFVLVILAKEKEIWRIKFFKIFKLCLPIVIIFLALSAYNWARFGNSLDSGYSRQDLGGFSQIARSQGILSFKHIPANLFYFLFSGPKPVLYDGNPFILKFPFIKEDFAGLSILFTSPFFLYVFSARLKEKLVWVSAITSFSMLLFVLVFFGIGASQYGYRFAIDFYPFLYVILLNSGLARRFPLKAKFLIITSVFLNWYLILT